MAGNEFNFKDYVHWPHKFKVYESQHGSTSNVRPSARQIRGVVLPDAANLPPGSARVRCLLCVLLPVDVC